jgi:hypothetical protein
MLHVTSESLDLLGKEGSRKRLSLEDELAVDLQSIA